jgi:hypothetical protein
MPWPDELEPPNAGSPVSAMSVPPSAGDQAIEPTTCVGSPSAIDCQVLPMFVERQTPPLTGAA